MINPQEVKSWQKMKEEGERVQWLLYFKLISRLKKDVYPERVAIRELSDRMNLQAITGTSMYYRDRTHKYMIKWMQNFKEEISFQQWENTAYRFTASQVLRENWYKTFY